MLFVAIVCLLSGMVAASPWPGKCPDLKPVAQIDLDKFLGEWTLDSIFTNNEPVYLDCQKLDYEKDDMGYTVTATTTLDPKTKMKTLARWDRITSGENKAEFVLSYLSGDKIRQIPMSILETDYIDYAILQSCKVDEESNGHFMFISFLTRSKLEGDSLQKVKAAISKYSYLAANTTLTFNDFKKYRC